MCYENCRFRCQFQKGELSNAELRILTEELGRIRYGDNEARIKHISIRGLLPDTEHYMTYEGSTTAPGCHETVTWIVLNKPIYITLQQVSFDDFFFSLDFFFYEIYTRVAHPFSYHANAWNEYWIRGRYKTVYNPLETQTEGVDGKLNYFFIKSMMSTEYFHIRIQNSTQRSVKEMHFVIICFLCSSLFTRNRNVISIWLQTNYHQWKCAVC